MEIGMVLGSFCLMAGIGGLYMLFKGMLEKKGKGRGQGQLPKKQPPYNLSIGQAAENGALQGEAAEEGRRLPDWAEEERLENLRARLLHLEKELWLGKANEPYERLFERIAMPMQSLFGLARASWASFPEERAQYYLWDVIAEPVLAEVRHGNGAVSGGKLTLLAQEVPFAQESEQENRKQSDGRELEACIWEAEAKLKRKSASGQKRRIVEGLGGIVEKLEGYGQSQPAERDWVKELAEEARDVFEENGIYPMFADDKRLEGDSRLRESFIPANQHSIQYPGLFIEREGRLEVLGAHIGMGDWED